MTFRRIINWVVGLPIAVIVIAFCVANRQWIEISFDPNGVERSTRMLGQGGTRTVLASEEHQAARKAWLARLAERQARKQAP